MRVASGRLSTVVVYSSCLVPTHTRRFKRLMFGRPLASDRLEHERLNKKTALAVLSSDAISSVAYATEQTLLVLAVLGTAALVVRRSNLGGHRRAAGARRAVVPPDDLRISERRRLVHRREGQPRHRCLVSLRPPHCSPTTSSRSPCRSRAAWRRSRPRIRRSCRTRCCLCIAVDRAARAGQSARRARVGHRVQRADVRLHRDDDRADRTRAVPSGAGHDRGRRRAPRSRSVSRGASEFPMPASRSTFLILRGFAEGCVAMTGTEAISNGVGAFQGAELARTRRSRSAGWRRSSPSSSSARAFSRVTTASCRRRPRPCCRSSAGTSSAAALLYYALQYSTFAILVLAANTAFADFPRLSSILADDGYMPRQFAARGDRLAFSNGIIALAVVAALLIWLFHGDTSALIPLYAIGVFVCFTLSQAGMVMHWLQTREPGWQRRAALNGIGAVATALVSIVQVVTKFTHGAWIVVLIIPLIIVVLRRIHRHYEHFARGGRVHGPVAADVPASHGDRAGQRHHEAGRRRARLCDDDLARTCARCTSRSIRIRREDLRRRGTDVGHRRRADDHSVAVSLDLASARRLRERTASSAAKRISSRSSCRRSCRGVGRASAAQQDVALHSHGVSVPAERRRDGGAVSRRTAARLRDLVAHDDLLDDSRESRRSRSSPPARRPSDRVQQRL